MDRLQVGDVELARAAREPTAASFLTRHHLAGFLDRGRPDAVLIGGALRLVRVDADLAADAAEERMHRHAELDHQEVVQAVPASTGIRGHGSSLARPSPSE